MAFKITVSVTNTRLALTLGVCMSSLLCLQNVNVPRTSKVKTITLLFICIRHEIHLACLAIACNKAMRLTHLHGICNVFMSSA